MIKLRNKFFDTYPFIFHMNGSYLKNPQGRRLRTRVFDFIKENEYEGDGGMRDATYFICTSYGERTTTLEKTLKYFKVPYVMKGRGTQGWRNTMKAGLLADYLPNISTKYTMGIDSHDVCLLKDANGIIDTFEEHFSEGCDMLFNGELVSYPTNPELAAFEREAYGKESPFCYLNSGVWIAKTDFLKAVIEDILTLRSSRPRSDQEIYRKLHKKYYPKIKVDHKCKLFQTTCNSSRKYLRDSKYDAANAYAISIDETESDLYELELKRD
ncbi:hypothetical protein CMI37_22125 [Candidatus Pacearchaeota archaeon]|nr:hypothetical protein [Candidatus Pacearchaeota archaeon]|tara:strand:- start:5782 stop:6588 length:807 start_codon:yes stop_codon:yes gene_type:complete